MGRHILVPVSSPSVDQLDISSTPSHSGPFERLEAFARHPSRKALRVLYYNGWLGESCDLSSAFNSLLALPSITNIFLETSSIVMLRDETLQAMAHAWPRLQLLDLRPMDPRVSFENDVVLLQYPATLHDLYALAQHCPSLRAIYLAVDPRFNRSTRADDADATDWNNGDFPPVAPKSSAVTELCVGFIETEHPVQVAGILSAMFPRLDIVNYGDPQGEYSSPGWAEVNRVLRVFKGVREQERSWARRQMCRSPAGTEESPTAVVNPRQVNSCVHLPYHC